MLKNHFKTAWRNLKRNRGYSLLNMFGLALGMACALLIMLWINDEWQYDRFHKNHGNLYAVYERQSYDGKVFTFPAMPGPFVPAIKAEIPEIKYAARTDWGPQVLFKLGDKSISESGLHVDPDFLKMFSFTWLKGNQATALADPSSIILTDDMARRFFGNEEAIGKTLTIEDNTQRTITGIIKTPPLNSSIRFSWLGSYEAFEKRYDWLKSWHNNSLYNYVQLKEGADPDLVNKKFENFLQQKDSTIVAHPFLLAAKDWRLRNNFVEGKQTGGRIDYVRQFGIIAILIIIIACINFMNLATARSQKRAREVGVRKVMGARRGTLIRQFFGESLVTSLTAMCIALLLVTVSLRFFNTLVEKELAIDFNSWVLWAGLPGIGILCGVLAGSYPSLYLSSFNPASVFRGLKATRGSVITYIRKGLVVVQFTVSIVLIISTIIIYKQIQHTKNRDLGYDKDQVLYVPLRQANDHFDALRQELLNTGVVEKAALSTSRTLVISSSDNTFSWPGKMANKEVLVSVEGITPGYLSTLRMLLKHGRDFSASSNADSLSVIINETFARTMQQPNPVGTNLDWAGRQLRIVGVVKDFVYNQMYHAPEPLLFYCSQGDANNLAIRLTKDAAHQQAIDKIEAVIKKFNPSYPFEYRFLNDDFNNLFKGEMLIGKISQLFAMLTILISCLGLLGLAAYTAEQRTKEIGIRKVMGASLGNVVTLLSKDFLLLVALASLVAFPLAWWLMHQWLQDFPYRISIQWWVFAIAGLAALAIALCTVSVQAVKAGLMNPVKSLKTE
jgi:putative ABC transport system permease protein